MAGEVIQNGLCPDSAASGRNEREPVDNTRAVLASISGAVKAALGVDGKLPHARKHAVFRCVAEAVQDALFPGGYPRSPGPYRCGLQFVDGAATVVGGTYRAPAAVQRGAVKISGAVHDRPGLRSQPVAVPSSEGMQCVLDPAVRGGRELKGDVPGSVETVARASDQIAPRAAGERARGAEVIRDRVVPAAGSGRQLENHAGIVRAAALRGAVKITGAAGDKAAIGFAPVPVAVLEVLQYGLSPFTVLYRTQFEHGPVVVFPATAGRAV